MEQVMKYSSPTKFDKAPYSTIWRNKFDDHCDAFIQVSEILDEPNWINMGTFLEKAFKEQLESEYFIEECLIKYKKLP
jgi:hypothetical protein